MPIYGNQKTKQMIRSVLPSSQRKQAKRRKDDLHRHNRHTVNQNLRKYDGYFDDVVDIYEDDESDLDYYIEPHRSNDDWEDIVYDRRMADKLAHFETWAYLKTKHLPPQDRYKKIASILDGALGTHALSHLEFLKYDPLERNTWHDNLPRQYRQTRYFSDYHLKQSQLRLKVDEAIRSIARDEKKRKAFNAYMIKHASRDIQIVRKYFYDANKAQYTNSRVSWIEEKVAHEGTRTLNGYHDIYKFVRDVFDARVNHPKLGYHPSWLKAICTYFNIE